MIIFRITFCKSKGRVPFCIHFSFILSFIFEKNGMKMKLKMMEKGVENETKMPTVNNPIIRAMYSFKFYSTTDLISIPNYLLEAKRTHSVQLIGEPLCMRVLLY